MDAMMVRPVFNVMPVAVNVGFCCYDDDAGAESHYTPSLTLRCGGLDRGDGLQAAYNFSSF